MAIFNQLTGYYAILYYAPRMFAVAGLVQEADFLSTIGIGLVQLLFMCIAIFFIDKFGRKFLMQLGSMGLLVTLIAIGISFNIATLGSLAVPIYLLLYLAFYAISQGIVFWVLVAEIFPNHLRTLGASVGVFAFWTLAALLATFFPVLSEKIGTSNIFFFFAASMLLQWLFVAFLMPETNGKSLEDMGKSNRK
jgi:MFS family permease